MPMDHSSPPQSVAQLPFSPDPSNPTVHFSVCKCSRGLFKRWQRRQFALTGGKLYYTKKIQACAIELRSKQLHHHGKKIVLTDSNGRIFFQLRADSVAQAAHVVKQLETHMSPTALIRIDTLERNLCEVSSNELLVRQIRSKRARNPEYYPALS